MYEMISDPGMGTSLPRVALALRTLAGRYRPGRPPFFPRFVGVVDIWKGV